MNELVHGYYAGERQTALIGVAIGAAFVVIAVLLWRASAAASVGRGAAYALVVAGLLQAAVSAGYVVITAGRAADAATLYSNQPDDAVVEKEEARVRGVLRSGFTGALAMNTALLAVGVILVFASQSAPLRKGVALALMIVGVTGHCLEAFSSQKNRRYETDLIRARTETRPVPPR